MEKQQHPDPRKDRDTRSPEPAAEIISARLWPSADEAVSSDARAWPDVDLDKVEGSLLPATRRLSPQFPVAGMQSRYLAFQQHRIQRNPRDLLAHVRRVMMEVATGDAASVNGALVDLFLVLGSRGRQLRRRLLVYASPQLDPGQRRFFREHLDAGLRSADITEDIPHSRLSQQRAGSVSIVKRRDAAASIEAVKLARDSIAAGHDEHAQSLLEGIVERDPGNEAACRELLGLYSRNGLRKSLLRTYSASLGRQLALPEIWRYLAAELPDERQ
ncbi:MAG: hypothetical protein QNJ00_18475 [Woeseiaceae bacterium]|nr:hypothetical protein [Woeseiaceae bacterium]